MAKGSDAKRECEGTTKTSQGGHVCGVCVRGGLTVAILSYLPVRAVNGSKLESSEVAQGPNTIMHLPLERSSAPFVLRLC